MVCIRRATVDDILPMQACDVFCLGTKQTIDHDYLHQILVSPQLVYVAEDCNGKTVGYVITGMKKKGAGGHFTSLAVMRTHMKSNLATELKNAVLKSMEQVYRSYYAGNVEETDKAALNLYNEKLGYRICKKKDRYYGNGENAYYMRKNLKERQSGKRARSKKGGRMEVKVE